jgi:hypothetical protein
MKTKFYSLFALVTLSFGAIAQGVGINETGAAPDPAAGLDINFNNKVFLPPRLTTEQRNGILSAPTGAMIYNITLACLQVNDGTPASPNWNCISNVVAGGAVGSIDCTGAINSGELVIGVEASVVNSVISYSGGNGLVHGGQVVTSTGVTGLTATLLVGAFASGSGTLTYAISGTPSSEGTASFAISIGGQTCTLTRTVDPVTVPNICNPSKPTAVVDVTNPTTGATWMDRNIGANRAAISTADQESWGFMFQWGRGPDGHQCVNRYPGDGVTTSGTWNNQAFNSAPNQGNPWDGLFIISSGNWLTPSTNALWQGVNGVNNPCPAGYRLPTNAEMNTERQSWSSNNAAGAFASQLKWSLTGYRVSTNGMRLHMSNIGHYWTSTVSSNNVFYLNISNTNAVNITTNRASGMVVRCIKN